MPTASVSLAVLRLLAQLAQQQGRLVQRVLNLEEEMALTKTDFDQKLGNLVGLMQQLQAVVESLVQTHTAGVDLQTEGNTVDQLTAQVQTLLNVATQALNS